MLQPVFTTKFKKNLKLQKKRGKQPTKITQIIEHICVFGDAPISSRPHNLVGDWNGYRECHIESDWLIVYKVFDDEVIFYATGTHQDLFQNY